MKILQIVQRQYVTLGISPTHQSDQKYSFNKRLLFGSLLLVCTLISQFVYIFHVASGFVEYLGCICVTSGTIIIIVCFAAIVFRKTILFESIDKTEKLIDTRCEYAESEALFLKTSQRIERVCETVFVVLMKFAVQLMILPKFIVSFCIYFTTDSGSDSFQLPLPMWFPFDSDNLIGYLIAIILEYIAYGYEIFVVACTLGLGIGSFWFALLTINEIQCILDSIKDKAQANDNQSNDLKVLFAEFIDTHSIVKQVAHDCSVTFQPIIMSLFTWSLFAISVAMFVIQIELFHHGDIVVLLLPLVNGIVGLTYTYIACELGQQTSDAFDEINSTIGQFDWYLFPIEIQRTLPMIIATAQQPVEMECFGSIACTREVFKKIINRAYSYFTVLSQFGD